MKHASRLPEGYDKHLREGNMLIESLELLRYLDIADIAQSETGLTCDEDVLEEIIGLIHDVTKGM